MPGTDWKACGECGQECQTPCYFLFMQNAAQVANKMEESKDEVCASDWL